MRGCIEVSFVEVEGKSYMLKQQDFGDIHQVVITIVVLCSGKSSSKRL